MPRREGVADCGATFEHDPHLFKTERGRTFVKACDGSTRKASEARRPE